MRTTKSSPQVEVEASVPTLRLDADRWTPLDDPVVRYLARANLRRGVPAANVAAALGICADTLCALLGVKADA